MMKRLALGLTTVTLLAVPTVLAAEVSTELVKESGLREHPGGVLLQGESTSVRVSADLLTRMQHEIVLPELCRKLRATLRH